ncbi:polysaccharide biosynthesis/export family protein [Silvibacterium sp.]|uniref:polysaccharide biosynthesis/export family protein n=1 Tax=Silvibacterium sp. TaxID=1964179 RepID=UPI0039E2D8B6
MPAAGQNVTRPGAVAAPPRIAIGPGDMLDVEVFDTPELSGTTRVNQSGEANLVVLGSVHLAGETANQAARTIEEELKSRGMMNNPHVSVSITEYATQGATITGEVKQPGVYPTLGSRTLTDMIALAGGPAATAGKMATIQHRDDPAHPINIRLAANPSQLAQQENPVIEPGDTVTVAKAGVVYVLGSVTKSGGFLIDNNDHISLLQAMSLAGGWTSVASTSHVQLIRKVPQGREEIRLDLKHVKDGKEADISIEDGDIVFVPTSFGKTVGYRSVEAILAAAQNAAYYAAAY